MFCSMSIGVRLHLAFDFSGWCFCLNNILRCFVFAYALITLHEGDFAYYTVPLIKCCQFLSAYKVKLSRTLLKGLCM